MNVSEAIKTKRAVRQFDERPVPDNVIRHILEAGGRSQSSKNTQPWQFIVVQDRETLKALSKMGDFAGHLSGAAFGVVLAGTRKGDWGAFDLGQASAYLQLAAHEAGVGSCIAAIYRPEEARALLGIPDEVTAFVALSFGYPALDHKPAKMGGRRPLNEVVRWERW